MGSAASSPNRDSSSDDRWWPIENQNLNLNPNEMETTNNSNSNETERLEAHSEDCEASISSAETRNNEGNFDIEATSSSSNEISGSDMAKVALESSVKSEISEKEATNRQQSLEEFKEELRIKRETRTSLISELRLEITGLRRQLAEEKEINKNLIAEQCNEHLCQICSSIYKSIETPDKIETILPNDETRQSTISLRSNLAEVQFSLQNANAEILTLSSELAATKKQAKTLKEVIAASKEIIEIRETELSQVTASSVLSSWKQMAPKCLTFFISSFIFS